MDLGLKDKRALVLGASGGLGKAVAKAFVDEGARTAICSRDQKRVSAAAAEIGAGLALQADLSKTGEIDSLIGEVEDAWGGVDILVVNSGGPKRGTFAELSLEDWRDGFDGVWMTAVAAVRRVIPAMAERSWGRILLITSVAAKEPIDSLTVSSAFRAGLLGLTKAVSTQHAARGVTVNALLPGFTDTDRLRELGVPLETLAERVPAKRIGDPAELAAAAAFLASERAGYITGQTLAVDGGYLKGI